MQEVHEPAGGNCEVNAQTAFTKLNYLHRWRYYRLRAVFKYRTEFGPMDWNLPKR